MQPATDRLPPHSRDAERGVLGGVLRDPFVFDTIRTLVGADEFYFDVHRKVFGAVEGLVRQGAPVDLVTLHEQLRAAGHLADVGGAEYLADLWQTAPTGANVVYHAGIVQDAALARRVIHAANEILRDAYDRAAPAADLLAAAERRLFDIRSAAATGDGPVIARTLVRDALIRIDGRYERGGGLNGLATGFPDLDRYLAGLKPGQLVVLGARPGAGKTALALNLAAHVAGAGVPTMMFSLEMDKGEITDRLLALGSGVSVSRINRGQLDAAHVEAIVKQGEAGGVGELRLWVDDAASLSADVLLSVTRRAVRRHGVGFVVVDYLQLLTPENPRETRAAQVGLMARRMKLLARECGVPVLLLSQLNREVESRADPRPVLSDLRESGEIEAHADAVVFLSTAANQRPEWERWAIDVGIRKNRGGPTGDVTLSLHRPTLKFESYRPD